MMSKLKQIFKLSLNLPRESKSHGFAQQSNRREANLKKFGDILETEIQKLKKGEHR